jgi:hypothetical protein
MMRRLKVFLPALAALMLAGCAAYHLGPVNGGEAGARTVEIKPFNNQTLQPRLNDDLTQALRERIQTDATYQLVTSEPGDIVISGVIRNYHREGLGYLNKDACGRLRPGHGQEIDRPRCQRPHPAEHRLGSG